MITKLINKHFNPDMCNDIELEAFEKIKYEIEYFAIEVVRNAYIKALLDYRNGDVPCTDSDYRDLESGYISLDFKTFLNNHVE